MMKKILFFVLLFSFSKISAQVSTYSLTESTEEYTPLQGTNSTAINSNGNQDNIPIGFTFNYSNVNYTTFSISTGGFIRLGGPIILASYAAITNALKANSTQKPVIAPLWDRHNRGTGTISYSVTGIAPNRVLIVDWNNINIGGEGLVSNEYSSFKLRLHETSNIIDFIYDDVLNITSSLSASIGLIDEVTYLSVTPGQPATTSALISNNVINETASFAGKKYSFSPPPACSGMPDIKNVSPAKIRTCVGEVPIPITGKVLSTNVSNLFFQWEESYDKIVWNNVVGTNGINSRILTPYVFDGTTRYYRLKVTCLSTGEFKYSSAAVISNAQIPVKPATLLVASGLNYSTEKLTWKNGDGYSRLVILNDTPDFIDPVNGVGPAIVANAVYSGSGQQYVYNDTGKTCNVSGLNCNQTYYAKVYEYQKCGSGNSVEYFFNLDAESTNTTSFTTGNPLGTLPLNNNFNLFTGANLIVAYPGWYESNIVTVAGTDPSSQNPITISSGWIKSTILGVPAAKITLTKSVINSWIISPKINLTEDSRLTFKAALTDYNLPTVDLSGGIATTDDKINILVSTDECGAEWTPIFTFSEANADLLTETLLEYVVDLSDYTGQQIQIAFQAVAGPVADNAVYDFHLTDILVDVQPPVVGLGDTTFATFKYYPNPVSNVLNISNGQELQSIVIYNILGQEVVNTTVNAAVTSLDMSSLANGVYTVKVVSEGKQKNFKIIKK